MQLAWTVAALGHAAFVGKLKPLSEYLTVERGPLSAELQKKQLEVFAGMWGLKVRPANKNLKIVRRAA